MKDKEKVKDLIAQYLGIEGKKEKVQKELKSFCTELVKIPLREAAVTLDAMKTKEGYAIYFNIFKDFKSKEGFLNALRDILRLYKNLNKFGSDYGK